MSLPTHATDKSRFQASRATLLIDRFMTVFIKAGGVLVITAVFGIFLFILLQVFPLFSSARVEELKTIPLPTEDKFTILGVDEWGKLPFLVEPDGQIALVDTDTATVRKVQIPLPAAAATPAPLVPAETTGEPGAAPTATPVPAPAFTASSYSARSQRLALGTTDGRFTLVELNYTAREQDGKQVVSADPRAGEFSPVGLPGVAIQKIGFGDAGTQKVLVAIQVQGDQTEATAIVIRRKRSLMGTGKDEVVGSFNLTPLLAGKPVDLLVPTTGDSVILVSEDGTVNYLAFRGEAKGFEVLQRFKPFEDLEDPTIAATNFLLGDVSLIFGSITGENRVFSLYYPEGKSQRLFGLTHQFPSLDATPSFITNTLRNKAFLIGGADRISLRYATTDTIRWQTTLPYKVAQGAISGKYERILLLDNANKLHFYQLDDPHPDAGWKALFGKVWYEGATGPKWEWQSTGGSDDFEPKLSLIPLIFGTLKGTLYAMLFAVPIALLAAIYTSQFLDPNLRSVVKPTMEIMASLPSVVLGFLAAIYIAPLIERQIPSLLLVAAGLPILAALFGWGWSNLPIRFRKLIAPGNEWLVFIPILLVGGGILWSLGPTFERFAFVTTDPTTGAKVADFRYWWPAATGATFDQRNSLVVGFMMGFAVIPIIFTITEDALSNVPVALRSGSLALGASRWQTALRVVVPTASAGVFSAIMIGLGRAVGETMIVVMATGNTPIMEWNIFSGMRTLSANIAVELPEAPHHGTLYRTLFLGALILFLLTFAVNTVAEIMRQHLREKYKTV